MVDSEIQLINERQTAAILAVSVGALRRWRYEGRGPRVTRIEGCVRYSKADLEDFLRKSSVAGLQTGAVSPTQQQADQ